VERQHQAVIARLLHPGIARRQNPHTRTTARGRQRQSEGQRNICRLGRPERGRPGEVGHALRDRHGDTRGGVLLDDAPARGGPVLPTAVVPYRTLGRHLRQHHRHIAEHRREPVPHRRSLIDIRGGRRGEGRGDEDRIHPQRGLEHRELLREAIGDVVVVGIERGLVDAADHQHATAEDHERPQRLDFAGGQGDAREECLHRADRDTGVAVGAHEHPGRRHRDLRHPPPVRQVTEVDRRQLVVACAHDVVGGEVAVHRRDGQGIGHRAHPRPRLVRRGPQPSAELVIRDRRDELLDDGRRVAHVPLQTASQAGVVEVGQGQVDLRHERSQSPCLTVSEPRGIGERNTFDERVKSRRVCSAVRRGQGLEERAVEGGDGFGHVQAPGRQMAQAEQLGLDLLPAEHRVVDLEQVTDAVLARHQEVAVLIAPELGEHTRPPEPALEHRSGLRGVDLRPLHTESRCEVGHH
jgi:hypothetical protein